MAKKSPEEPNELPAIPDPFAGGERERLHAVLTALGATEAEIVAAMTSHRAGDFAVELALRTGPPLTIEEAAAAAGVDPAEFLVFWRALGLAVPPTGVAAVPADVVATAPPVSQVIDAWLGRDVGMGVARVVGAASARIAEALVDAFRLGFEVPELSAGTSYVSVVQQYADITRLSMPAFEAFLMAVLKAHVVRVASDSWAPDADNRATRRELFVGFVDLVGYTALARTLDPAELAALLARFEDLVADVITAGGGRLVKLIGDGAMFVADSPEDGCAVALALCERLAVTETLPPARVGADCGSVFGRQGDYFGDVVNRAARLVALALPGAVVVSDTVAEAVDGKSFGVERLPPQALKGYLAPAVTYRLLPR